MCHSPVVLVGAEVRQTDLQMFGNHGKLYVHDLPSVARSCVRAPLEQGSSVTKRRGLVRPSNASFRRLIRQQCPEEPIAIVFKLMPQFRVPLPVMCKDDDLPVTELFLKKLKNHPTVSTVKAHHHIIQEQGSFCVGDSLCHCQENAEAKTVSKTL